MAEGKPYTNETDELITLYNGRPILPGQTAVLSEHEQEENPGWLDTLTEGEGSEPEAEQQESDPEATTKRGKQHG